MSKGTNLFTRGWTALTSKGKALFYRGWLDDDAVLPRKRGTGPFNRPGSSKDEVMHMLSMAVLAIEVIEAES